jgi:hypothetical protein
MRTELMTVAVIAAALAAACGSGSSKPGVSAVPTAAPTSAVQSLPATVSAGQPAAATPATNPASRVSGTVQSVDGNTVTLKEGGSFTVAAATRISKTVPATTADLVPGKVVAVTAQKQQDDSLLASQIRIFAAAPSATFFTQFPMGDGNLMTNATIDQGSGNSFTVTFPGGGGKVNVAPNAQIASIVAGTPADITAGATVSASVLNGVAQSVSIG